MTVPAVGTAGAAGVLTARALAMAATLRVSGPNRGGRLLAGGYGGRAYEQSADRKGDKDPEAQWWSRDQRSVGRPSSQRPKLATIELAVAAFPRSGSRSSSSVVRRRE